MDSVAQIPRTPLRVVELLRELGASANNLSLTDLANRLKMPKSSTLNLLRALQTANYVEQIDGHYRLGIEAMKLAATIATNQRKDAAIHGVLERLGAVTGETIQLGILAPDEPVALCIDMVESLSPLRYSLHVGLRRPLYCTSIGKLILAFSADNWVDSYFANLKPQRFTDNTLVDLHDLRQEINRYRLTGISISFDGMILGASGMSAAIFAADGSMVSGLTVSAPTNRMQPSQARFREALIAAAIEASAINGYTGPYPTASEGQS